jgi:hypothetical protein
VQGTFGPKTLSGRSAEYACLEWLFRDNPLDPR